VPFEPLDPSELIWGGRAIAHHQMDGAEREAVADLGLVAEMGAEPIGQRRVLVLRSNGEAIDLAERAQGYVAGDEEVALAGLRCWCWETVGFPLLPSRRSTRIGATPPCAVANGGPNHHWSELPAIACVPLSAQEPPG
jgi:hypothetical protein